MIYAKALMAKQRVLIIGGGMSALTTAYQLSRTAELRERYAITIYQTGWKLGGTSGDAGMWTQRPSAA